MKVNGKGSMQMLEPSRGRYRCNRWRLFVQTEDGTKTRRVTGKLAEAKEQLDAFIAELEDEAAASRTFAEYAAGWLEYRRTMGVVSPATIRRDEGHVKVLSHQFGSMDMRKIDPDSIRAGFVAMRTSEYTGKQRSGCYMGSLHITLGAIMRQAVGDGIIQRNPMDGVKRPKSDTKERDAMTREQVSAMLDALDLMEPSGYVLAVYLMACLGLRRSEALGLLWEDVDGGSVTVRRSWSSSTREYAPTKNGKPRTLPMPKRLAAKLEDGRRWQDERLFDCDAVCCNLQGGHLSSESLNQWWAKNAESIGAGGFTQHQLRHSNLTMMARLMPSAFDLQRWAGWSSLAPAMIYVHDDRDALESAASRMPL